MAGKSVLVRGPAGSGKTTHCLRRCCKALEESEPGRIVYLVPSAEAVRDIERRLLQVCARRGLLGPVVNDFTGLGLRILKEAGYSPLHRISPFQRKYLIFSIIRDTPLGFFGNVKNYDGFCEVAAEFIAELKRAMISPEDFLQACLDAGGRRGIAEAKVRELHAVYRAYQDALRNRGVYDGDGILWKAAEVLLADSPLLSEMEWVFADGFATYTPVEFKMLSQLVERAGRSYITLCYEDHRADVFAFVEETHSRLKTLCAGGETVLDGNHRSTGALLHLERTLFGVGENEVPSGGTVGIFPCSDPYHEVNTLARQIENIRREERLEYSDFTVIFREAGEYLPAVTDVFEKREIPYSLASGPAILSQEPFVRVAISALELVKGEFSREQLLAVLKSSSLPAEPDVTAALENYADEFGLWEEELFRNPWTEPGQTTKHVAVLNDYKARFLDILDRLRSEAMGASSAEKFRQLIFTVIGEFKFLRDTEQSGENWDHPLHRWEAWCPPLSCEYRSLTGLSRVLDGLCEYGHLMGFRQGDYSVYVEMLKRALAWTPVPSVPRIVNSVRVTSIVGGAPPASAVVFICGLCEQSFPKEVVSDPLLRDGERRLINRGGEIMLEERHPLSSGERFFFYIAASRATQRLILTYPTTDGRGKELVRSHYLEEVTRVFSDLSDAADEAIPAKSVVQEFTLLADIGEVRSFVAHHLSRRIVAQPDHRDEESTLAALTYNELLRRGDLGPAHLIYTAEKERLSEEVCRDLREKETYFTSVTELETFARCPFRHFCEYRLRLRELPRYEFGPMEEGMLCHDVLARLYRGIYRPSTERLKGSDDRSNRPQGIEGFSPEELDSKLSQLVDEFISKGYTRLLQSPRPAVRRRALQTKIRDFLLKEMENERANATVPAYFELSFGRGKSHQNADAHSTDMPLPIEAEGHPGILISGRMDRVDIFEGDQESFSVVLDYKRSAHVSRSGLREGTVLQPGIYMLALEKLFGLRSAGAFYYSISSGRKRGIFAKEEEARISGQGDVSRMDKASYEEIRELMELSARQVAEYVQRIVEGEIAVHPADKNECRTCPFMSVCRIREHKPLQ